MEPVEISAPTKWQQARAVAAAAWASPWGKFLITAFLATWAVALCHSRVAAYIPPQLCRLAESLVSSEAPPRP